MSEELQQTGFLYKKQIDDFKMRLTVRNSNLSAIRQGNRRGWSIFAKKQDIDRSEEEGEELAM